MGSKKNQFGGHKWPWRMEWVETQGSAAALEKFECDNGQLPWGISSVCWFSVSASLSLSVGILTANLWPVWLDVLDQLVGQRLHVCLDPVRTSCLSAKSQRSSVRCFWSSVSLLSASSQRLPSCSQCRNVGRKVLPVSCVWLPIAWNRLSLDSVWWSSVKRCWLSVCRRWLPASQSRLSVSCYWLSVSISCRWLSVSCNWPPVGCFGLPPSLAWLVLSCWPNCWFSSKGTKSAKLRSATIHSSLLSRSLPGSGNCMSMSMGHLRWG